MKIELTTNSANDTIEFGKSVARAVEVGSVISLVGDLGAGKTTFTKGVARGLGIMDNVTSPTFTILNEYAGEEKKLYHFDFYRIEDESELVELGFEDYFPSTDGITIVEWVKKAPSVLPKRYYQITFEKIDDDKRKIVFEEVVK